MGLDDTTDQVVVTPAHFTHGTGKNMVWLEKIKQVSQYSSRNERNA
jgi:hypothetical protein